MADARTPATLLRIKGDASQVFHGPILFPFFAPLKRSNSRSFSPLAFRGSFCAPDCPRLTPAFEARFASNLPTVPPLLSEWNIEFC
jgi:hypothetical protein